MSADPLRGPLPVYMAVSTIDEDINYNFSVQKKQLKELEWIEKKACMCKIAAKVTGCICLPLTWTACCLRWVFPNTPGCCLYSCMVLCDRICQADNVPQSSWSSIDCRPFCLARSTPDNCCELCLNVFDLCVCCCCFAKETQDNYLLQDSRERLRELRRSLETSYSSALLARKFGHFNMFDPKVLPLIEEYSST